MQTLMSIVGIFTLLGIAYAISGNRSAINRRTVLTAFALQTSIAALILFVPQGSAWLDVVVRGVQHVINYANDGIEFVTLDPTIANPISAPHPRSRVRVKCSDNIFYDLSDTDLTIEGDMMSPDVALDDTAVAAYSFVTSAIATATVAPACGVPVECAPPAVSGRSAGRSSGAFDYLWLLMMTAIVALVKCYRRYGLQ